MWGTGKASNINIDVSNTQSISLVYCPFVNFTNCPVALANEYEYHSQKHQLFFCAMLVATGQVKKIAEIIPWALKSILVSDFNERALW